MTSSEKTDLPQDTILVGLGAAPGIAAGEIFLLNRARMVAVERSIAAEEVADELDRFRRAVQQAKDQLEAVKGKVGDPRLAEHLYIIDTHLLILEDQLLIDDTERCIVSEKLNAEGALKRTLGRFRGIFEAIEDEYLRERRSDIDSVGDRLLRNLMGVHQQGLAEIDRKVIVVAHELSPADTMQIDKERVIGFVTDLGGRTSHTAILARSLGIPAIVGLENITTLVADGTPSVIDGSTGTVVLYPSSDTVKEFSDKKRYYDEHERELLAYRDLPAQTVDGFSVTLRCNIELADEVPLALGQGAEGVGLFRSEFLFLNRPAPPEEEEQFKAYCAIVEKMSPHPVTIRTLDVGGDKFVPEINLTDETNPAMGLRAVRFSLKEGRLFKTQLRAILRASAFGRIRLMFPMISGVDEVRACKAYLEEAKKELLSEGVAFDPHFPVGVMIEIPSAAIIADLLAKEVDFFSIGTNDLIQYCLAVDRGNEHVAYLYEPLHPAILRALQTICRAARDAGISVGMCGEMASEPLYTLILVGFGFDELSMNAPCIPRVKRILRQVRQQEGESLVEELMRLGTAGEIGRRLDEEMGRRFPEYFAPPLI